MSTHPFTKQVSVHGKRAYLTGDNKQVARGAFATGGEDSQGNKGGSIVLPGSPGTVAIFDDFLGDTGQTTGVWQVVEGDTGVAGGATKITGVGGVLRLLTVDNAPLAPAGGVIGITNGLQKQWKANQGDLRFACRLKIGTLAGTELFVGFSDSGGAEMPAYDTGGLITNMADGVGFIYGGNLAGDWQAASARSVAGDSGDGDTGINVTPVANVYQVLELWLGSDSGQFARFYVNGKYEGRISKPINAATALTPGVWMFASDAAALNVDVDWINVSANRDTGL